MLILAGDSKIKAPISEQLLYSSLLFLVIVQGIYDAACDSVTEYVRICNL